MNPVLEQLFDRKSVRAYEDKPIEPEKKQQIIQAALEAPTAGNMTLYTIIDVTDQTLKDTLAETCDHQPFIAKAPLVLIFCADYQKWYEVFCACEEEVRRPALGDLMLAFADTFAAAQNAVTAAWSMGIGSCYIGDILERYETHRKLLNLPKYVLPAAMLVFGYPTQQQADRIKPRRIAREAVVCENIYQPKRPEEFLAALGARQHEEGEELQRWLRAFCKRKWNSEFSQEMSRSVQVMLEEWME